MKVSFHLDGEEVVGVACVVVALGLRGSEQPGWEEIIVPAHERERVCVSPTNPEHSLPPPPAPDPVHRRGVGKVGDAVAGLC